MKEHCIFQTAWGWCGIVLQDDRLVATELPVRLHKHIASRIAKNHSDSVENDRLMPQLVEAIRGYFDGKKVTFDVPLDLTSQSDFRRRVLQACARIPRGQMASYADLARAAGSPKAARAAGAAMANNPLPLVVPCHRVIRSDGQLGGFSSPDGLKQKKDMLELEGAYS